MGQAGLGGGGGVGSKYYKETGFPGGASGKEPACQCRRCKWCRFDSWVGKLPWRRAWQPTPVFLPGESNGQRSLVDYSPWGCKESDTTEVTEHSTLQRGTRKHWPLCWSQIDTRLLLTAGPFYSLFLFHETFFPISHTIHSLALFRSLLRHHLIRKSWPDHTK